MTVVNKCEGTDHTFEFELELECQNCGISLTAYLDKLKSKMCRMGEYCDTHQVVHGAEAEALRSALESLYPSHNLDGNDYVDISDVRAIPEEVDAADSCAFVEKYTNEKLTALRHELTGAYKRIAQLEENLKVSP